MYEYNATLLKVVDGDTLDAKIDLGFNIFIKKRIRLINIDAPEVRTTNMEEKKKGKRAKAFLKKVLKKNNSKFILKSHGFGKFGRCLGEIFINNRSVNDMLLDEGLVTRY